MARRPCEADLAGEDHDRFAAAMMLCMDASGACVSRGWCTHGDCFRNEAQDFRQAERRLSRFILEQEDPMIADWLRVGLEAMQKVYRAEKER